MQRIRDIFVGVVLLAALAVMAGCGGETNRSATLPSQSGSGVRPASVQPAEVLPANGQQYLGDMDGDGNPSVGDAIKILRIVVGLDPADPCADANQNGGTDVGDAIMVLRCVVGLDPWPIVGGEEAAIRQLYEDFAAACNAGDINALSNLFSESYLNDGVLKNDQVDGMEESFNEQPDLRISFTIQQIQVQDSHATVHVTFEVTFAEGTQTFTEPVEPGDESPLGVAWLVKEGGSWLVYGDQEWYWLFASSHYDPLGGGGPYYGSFCVGDPTERLISASVSGPGIAGSLAFSPQLSWGEVKWWANVQFGSAPPSAPNEYTFTLVDADGTTTWTATIEDYFTQSAVNVKPNNETVSAANLVFTWDECPQAVDYAVQLHRGDDWPGQEVWQEYHSVPNIPYTGPPLAPGNYFWLAVMENANGNESFTRAQFTVAP